MKTRTSQTWTCIECGEEVCNQGHLRCERCWEQIQFEREHDRNKALAEEHNQHYNHLAVLAALQEQYDREAVARHRRIEEALA